jgi:hypothetical protein
MQHVFVWTFESAVTVIGTLIMCGLILTGFALVGIDEFKKWVRRNKKK